MAEEVEEDDDNDEYEEEMYDDYALREFRFFWNNINGEEHDEEDNDDEEHLEQDWEDEEDENQNVSSTEFVTEKLREQGITFEQLVKIHCNQIHEEYYGD